MKSDTHLANAGDTSSLRGDEINSVPEALRVPIKAIGPGFQLLLFLANTAIWLSILPISQILLPLQVEALDASTRFSHLSIITAVGVLAALITNPIVGALSDRTTLSMGRRRSWCIVGTVLSAVTLALMANATSFLALVLWWGLFHIAANMVLAALSAVVPDQVPVRQRATVSAYVSLSLPVGSLFGILLVTRAVKSIPLAYFIFIGILVVIMAVFLLLLRDLPLPKGSVPRFKLGSFLASFWVNPRQYPDFAWAWFTRLLVYLSYFLALGYLLYFLQDAVHYQNASQGVASFQMILTGTLLVASILAGVFSDRIQRRKVFVMGASFLITLSFLILAFSPTWPAVLVAAAVLGFGFGGYLGVDLALITQVLPLANARGKDLGVINIANALPQVVGSALAALVINTFHSYTLLFVAAAVLASLSAVLIQRVKSVL